MKMGTRAFVSWVVATASPHKFLAHAAKARPPQRSKLELSDVASPASSSPAAGEKTPPTSTSKPLSYKQALVSGRSGTGSSVEYLGIASREGETGSPAAKATAAVSAEDHRPLFRSPINADTPTNAASASSGGPASTSRSKGIKGFMEPTAAAPASTTASNEDLPASATGLSTPEPGGSTTTSAAASSEPLPAGPVVVAISTSSSPQDQKVVTSGGRTSFYPSSVLPSEQGSTGSSPPACKSETGCTSGTAKPPPRPSFYKKPASPSASPASGARMDVDEESGDVLVHAQYGKKCERQQHPTSAACSYPWSAAFRSGTADGIGNDKELQKPKPKKLWCKKPSQKPSAPDEAESATGGGRMTNTMLNQPKDAGTHLESQLQSNAPWRRKNSMVVDSEGPTRAAGESKDQKKNFVVRLQSDEQEQGEDYNKHSVTLKMNPYAAVFVPTPPYPSMTGNPNKIPQRTPLRREADLYVPRGKKIAAPPGLEQDATSSIYESNPPPPPPPGLESIIPFLDNMLVHEATTSREDEAEGVLGPRGGALEVLEASSNSLNSWTSSTGSSCGKNHVVCAPRPPSSAASTSASTPSNGGATGGRWANASWW